MRKNILVNCRDFVQLRRPVRGVAQPGRAPALGAGSRQFESGRPDHQKSLSIFLAFRFKNRQLRPRLTGSSKATNSGLAQR